ncbi:MAG: 2-dehydropantoate 2-reductase [Verrucomicrobiales bacterium]|nr:2-dehydropantoate 2-reductase [Verrucomicrobiales bacterium]
MKIAVVGSGAVGCFYGGNLALTGDCDVHFLMRSDLETVRRDGLFLKSECRGDVHLRKINCHASTAEIGAVDLVFVAIKATDNDVLKSLITPLLGDSTAIMTLQNGLGSDEQLAKLFGAERILGGLCFVCLNRTAPGVIHHIGHGLIEMGEFATRGETSRAIDIRDRFRAAKIDCNIQADIGLARWRKLVWNVPFNGLAIAGGGIDVAQILADPELHRRTRALMAEVIEAAECLGHKIPVDFIDENVNRTIPMGDYKPSSLLDFLAGRPVEIEPIWGEALRRGQAAGCEMPELKRLYREIREA